MSTTEFSDEELAVAPLPAPKPKRKRTRKRNIKISQTGQVETSRTNIVSSTIHEEAHDVNQETGHTRKF